MFYVYFLRFTLFPCIFLCFCSHFLCVSSHFLHFHNIFYDAYCITFLFISRALCYCPAFSHVFALISSAYHDFSRVFTSFSNIFYDFYYIILPYSATKMADLGGIDTPPSANCLVFHHLAKCSIQPPFSQPESEIWYYFVNHSPPHSLFSLCLQTATSQLAAFRKKNIYISLYIYIHTYSDIMISYYISIQYIIHNCRHQPYLSIHRFAMKQDLFACRRRSILAGIRQNCARCRSLALQRQKLLRV